VSDIFHEVEEDVRRERLEKLWKRYGNYFIATAAVLVIGVAGYQIWQQWDKSRRQAASDQFHTAELMAQQGRVAEAENAFARIAQDGPSGYATLAKFDQAGLLLAEGKGDQAIALYTTLSQLDDPQLSGAARIRIAWAKADYAPRPEIEKVLAPIDSATNPWRFPAQEVLAYVTLRDGPRDAAIKAYQALADATQAPANLRERAQAVAEYLTANPNGNAPPAIDIPDNKALPANAPATETKPK